MPLVIRIEAVGLEEGEQPSIAVNTMADIVAVSRMTEMPPEPEFISHVPVPFLTDTLVLS